MSFIGRLTLPNFTGYIGSCFSNIVLILAYCSSGTLSGITVAFIWDPSWSLWDTLKSAWRLLIYAWSLVAFFRFRNKGGIFWDIYDSFTSPIIWPWEIFDSKNSRLGAGMCYRYVCLESLSFFVPRSWKLMSGKTFRLLRQLFLHPQQISGCRKGVNFVHPGLILGVLSWMVPR